MITSGSFNFLDDLVLDGKVFENSFYNYVSLVEGVVLERGVQVSQDFVFLNAEKKNFVIFGF